MEDLWCLFDLDTPEFYPEREEIIEWVSTYSNPNQIRDTFQYIRIARFLSLIHGLQDILMLSNRDIDVLCNNFLLLENSFIHNYSLERYQRKYFLNLKLTIFELLKLTLDYDLYQKYTPLKDPVRVAFQRELFFVYC